MCYINKVDIDIDNYQLTVQLRLMEVNVNVNVSFIYIAHLKSLWPTKVLYRIQSSTITTIIRNNKRKAVKLKIVSIVLLSYASRSRKLFHKTGLLYLTEIW